MASQTDPVCEARCICGWREEFPDPGSEEATDAEGLRRHGVHVASGECPEKRDADGNIVFDEVDDCKPPVEPGKAWTCEDGHRHFVCAHCERVCTVEDDDHDPLAEAQEVLGEVPEEEDRDSVCDDCYPILVAWAKEQGLIP